MTPEEQRIAIAEACGWSEINWIDNPIKAGVSKYLCGHPPGLDGQPSQGTARNDVFLPNYLSDLNAVHEAEKVLTKAQRDSYMHWLISVTRKAGDQSPDYAEACTRATAAQRCEAFLKTLGLWVDLP